MTDAMILDAPAAQEELSYLRTVKVGDTRASALFPALGASVEWICRVATKDHWEWEGRFLGQPLFRANIDLGTNHLTLDLEG